MNTDDKLREIAEKAALNCHYKDEDHCLTVILRAMQEAIEDFGHDLMDSAERAKCPICGQDSREIAQLLQRIRDLERMNTEDKPEWPDIIGSGDYKKALSGGEKVIAQTEASGCVSGEPSLPTQLREIAEKCVAQINCPFQDNPKVLEAVLRAMQEARELSNDEQYKYGYKKGLGDGDDTHALQ